MIVIEIGTCSVYAHSYTTEARAREIFEAGYLYARGDGGASQWLLREADDETCWFVLIVDESGAYNGFDWAEGTPYPIDEAHARSFIERRQQATRGEIGGTRRLEGNGVVSTRDTLPPGTEVRVTPDGTWDFEPS